MHILELVTLICVFFEKLFDTEDGELITTVYLTIGPLQDPVTWYGINYAGTQVTQWDFQNKGTRTGPARLSFVWEVPLRNLRPSVINSVPCDRILQRANLPEPIYNTPGLRD